MYSEIRLPHGAALWRSTRGGGGAIPADGCVDLILRDGRVWVAGPSTRWIATLADGAGGSLGIRLPPGSAGDFLGVGLSEIADDLVPLDDVLPARAARRVRETMLPLGDGKSPTDAVAAIAGRVGGVSGRSTVVHGLATRGVSAGTAARELDESERTFRRLMNAEFGYGYATLVRIERARRAQDLLRRGIPPIDAAAGAGFADQPHLSREFRRLVGMSPGQFVASAA